MSNTTITIPTLDLNLFLNGNNEDRTNFCNDLGKAYKEIGFVVIKNHGLSKELKDNLYTQVKKFFAMDEEFKKKHEKMDIFGQRGYTSKGREKAKDSDVPDLKEFWQWGQYVEDNDSIKEKYFENIFVEEMPEFNQVAKEAYKKLESIGRELLKAISLFLGLEENYFDSKIHNGDSILRMIHYFPLVNVDLPEGSVRAGAHEDINLITLLMGASAEGLQVKTLDGEWLSINAKEDELVINVGDMLQRLTNNVLVSTTHQVVNPPKELLATPRYSIPFFLHPRPDMDLSCLPSCVTAENPKRYEDVTAGEYLHERLKEIGLMG